ncbi:MAG: hypothetical protein CMJ68_09760 [Planctomycetaceae bacterium]|nr:hypothetical protein [Planctomycetaceae bacterium]
MDFLFDLWIPILASAAAVFVVSSIVHLVLPIHKNDYASLPDEEAILAALRDQQVGPGEYSFPFTESMQEMQEPATIEKYSRGPVGFLTVMPSGPPGIGKNLVIWFAYSILISVFAAYITSFLAINSPREAFRLTGTVAVLAYAATHIYNSIWKAQPWQTTLKNIFDGILYGLVTAAIFASLGNWGV